VSNVPLAPVPGSKVRHPDADPSVAYAPARRIDVLEQVGAIDAETAEAARAIDGFDGSPRDGRVQLTEIEAAVAQGSKLDPAHRRCTAQLLRALALAPVIEPSPPPNLLPRLTVEDVTALPPRVDVAPWHAPVPIASLDPRLQGLAREILELVVPRGRVAITVNDLAHPAARRPRRPGHTYEENQRIAARRYLLHDLERNVRAEAWSERTPLYVARARVPMPGREVICLFHDGGTALRLVVDTEIREDLVEERAPGWDRRTHALMATRRTRLEADVPPGYRAAFVGLDVDHEAVANAGTVTLEIPAGRYRVDLYAVDVAHDAEGVAAGPRAPAEASEVVVPAFVAKEELDLRAWRGFQFFGDDGVPLHSQPRGSQDGENATSRTWVLSLRDPTRRHVHLGRRGCAADGRRLRGRRARAAAAPDLARALRHPRLSRAPLLARRRRGAERIHHRRHLRGRGREGHPRR
jgi:hypothetical protein